MDGELRGRLTRLGSLNIKTSTQGNLKGNVQGSGATAGGKLKPEGKMTGEITTLGGLQGHIQRAGGGSYEWVHPLPDFSIADYDWDIWEYLGDKVEAGFYSAHETENDE